MCSKMSNVHSMNSRGCDQAFQALGIRRVIPAAEMSQLVSSTPAAKRLGSCRASPATVQNEDFAERP